MWTLSTIQKLWNAVRTAAAHFCSGRTGRNQVNIPPKDDIPVPSADIVNIGRKMTNFTKDGYWLTSDGKPSHFHKDETKCHCGCEGNEVSQRLLDKMEEQRIIINHPFIIHSWYRCPEHNAQIGGAKSSGHLTGEAVDFRCLSLSLAQLWLFYEKDNFNGLGAYPEDNPSFLHCDVLNLRYMRWVKRDGKYWYLF